MQKKWLCTLIVLNTFGNIDAQDSTKESSLKISGSADVYYQYDFANPKTVPYNNLTVFTRSQNSFELGMISLKVEHTIGKAAMVADIGFGKRAAEFSYNEEGSSASIKQLYITYAATSKFKLTVGSWATHIGYELADAYLNRNYSMSNLFSNDPFSHTGLKGEFALTENSGIMLGVANPSDLKSAGDLPKMIIGQLYSFSADEKFKAYLNYQGGKSDDSGRLYQGDLVLNYALTEKFSLGYNGSLQSRQVKNTGKWGDARNWLGNALYINADPNKWLRLTWRLEYFEDKRNVLGLNTSIFVSTISANFKIDNLTIIPEFRFEKAGKDIYSGLQGSGINNRQSILIGAAYHF